ncbi:MAG TPA: methyltransferase domain-containing protein [Myxococcaceae bacterium]|nr:methyltransferase domain-containing protein [Myxococcaceae bacterium]
MAPNLQTQIDEIARRLGQAAEPEPSPASPPQAGRDLVGSFLAQIQQLLGESDPTPRPPFAGHRARGAGLIRMVKTTASSTLRPFNRFLFQRQAELNDRLLKLLADLARRAGAIADRVAGLERQMANGTAQLWRSHESLQRELANVRRKAEGGHPEGSYLAFEEAFRGAESDIRGRVSIYVDLLRSGGGKVLELGCGRGELLELAAAAGLDAEGVDSNEPMAQRCREKGLRVRHEDLFTALEGTAPGSLGAIAAIQVVEHLNHTELDRLCELSSRRLKPGGLVLFETINPHSLEAMKFYFADPTHRTLCYPELMRWFLQRHGFQKIEVTLLHPVEAARRLPVPEAAELRPLVERLNEILFGPQDYFIVGRR